MTNSSEWKSKLVSSSLPLEYECAQILVSKGFSLTADYKYSRIDSNDSNEKDFSVDLDAALVYNLHKSDQGSTHLELLVECKQKKPDSKWFFLPDPNPLHKSEISTRGDIIHPVDEFSRYFFSHSSKNKLSDFFEKRQICYKGTEINLTNGNVFDSEIKHGISQLQYALPRLLIQNIVHCLKGFVINKSYSYLFMYCPILVTTADIYVAKDNLKTIDIENADTLDQIAEQVPCLIISSDIGPDFETHCIRESEKLAIQRFTSSLKELEKIRDENGGYEYRSPLLITRGLLNADTFRLQEYFTQFIVCSKDYFPILLDEMKEISKNATVKISNKMK